MKEIKLDMQYKGSRDYLHGTDFYSEISSKIKEKSPGWLKKIAFKNFAKKQCFVVFDKPDVSKRLIGNGFWQSTALANLSSKFWIVEADTVVTGRYPFDEELLLKNTVIKDNKIILSVDNGFSTIENIVALTKKINYHLSPNIKGKWVFSQIELKESLKDFSLELAIVRHSELQSLFSRNLVEVDGMVIGEIRFMVANS